MSQKYLENPPKIKKKLETEVVGKEKELKKAQPQFSQAVMSVLCLSRDMTINKNNFLLLRHNCRFAKKIKKSRERNLICFNFCRKFNRGGRGCNIEGALKKSSYRYDFAYTVSKFQG